MQGGDLHDALHLSNQITWNTGGKQLAAQIALGLHELHLQRVSGFLRSCLMPVRKMVR